MINLSTLPVLSTEALFDLAFEAMEAGRLNDAMTVVSEMCRAKRAGSFPVELSDVSTFSKLSGFSAEVLSALQDRIDQYNSHV